MAEFIFSAFADEAGGGLLHQIEALKANGITHIEPRGLDEGNISTFSAAQVREVKKILDEHGIGVSSVGSHFGKINTPLRRTSIPLSSVLKMPQFSAQKT